MTSKMVFAELPSKKAKKVVRDASLLLASLQPNENLTVTNDDENIVYFLAGYIARSQVKRSKCKGCQDLIVKSVERSVCFIDDDTSIMARSCHSHLTDTEDQLRRTCYSQGSVLCDLSAHLAIVFKYPCLRCNIHSACCTLFQTLKLYSWVPLTLMCSSEAVLPLQQSHYYFVGHNFAPCFNAVSCALFNMMSKNFASEINDQTHASQKWQVQVEASKRKHAKLTGD